MLRQKEVYLATFLFVMSLTLAAYAEIATWGHSYGDGESDFYASSIKATSDGGFILSGEIATWVGTSHNNGLLMRLNSSGGLIWSLQDTQSTPTNRVNYAEQTNDGGFIVCGKLESGAWIMKLDNDGNIQWQKTYAELVESNREVVKIHQIRSNGYVMVGNEIAPDFSYAKMWLAQIDVDGNIIWQKRYIIPGETLVSVSSLEATPDGGYIISGERQGSSWILKTDSSGAIIWQKFSVGGYLGPISPTSDGGYFALGHDGVNSLFLKMNNLGEIQWQKMIDPVHLGWIYAYVNSFQELPDGGYLLSGSGSLPDWPYTPHGWLIKINAKGKLLWQKTFPNVFYRTLTIPTADGGIALAGGEFSYLSNEYGPNSIPVEENQKPSDGTLGQNILILKLNKNGNVDTFCGTEEKFLFQNSELSLQDGSLSVEIPAVQTTPVSYTFSRSEQWEFENHAFCDEFEKGLSPKDWRYHGNWSQKRGKLIGNGAGSKNATALIPLQNISYYAIRAELQTSGGHDDEVSLIAWWQDKDNYVELTLSKDYHHWAFQRWVNGTVTDYDSVSREIVPDYQYAVSIVLLQQQSGRVLVANTGGWFLYLPFPDDASMIGKAGFRAQGAKGVFGSLRVLGDTK